MSAFTSRWLDFAPIQEKELEPPTQQADKTDKSPKASVTPTLLPTTGAAVLAPTSNTVPRLPWQLERLLAAAASGVLTVDLPGVPDVQRYTLAWGVTYLIKDRNEALTRLWAVHEYWEGGSS